MASDANFKKLRNGINLVPNDTTLIASIGDIDYSSDTGLFNVFDGSGTTSIVTASGTVTLTNKTINASNNTILNLTNTNLNGSAAISNANLASMAAHTYKGNNTGSSSTPLNVTSTQLTADLDIFTTSLQGLVPASGGGTVNFLRADGTFATPPGAAGGVTTVGAFSGSSQPNGATISSTTITFGPANASNPGMVTTGAQTITGTKTFSGGVATATIFDNGTPLSILGSGGQDISIVPGSSAILYLKSPIGTGLKQVTTPGVNPNSGYNTLYFKSDENLYSLSSAGVETKINAGSPTAVDMYSYYVGGGLAVTTDNPIKFNTVSSDTNSGYSTSTGLYTAQVAGKYVISAGVFATSNAFCYVAINSTRFPASTASLFSIDATYGSGSIVVNLSINDTVSINTDRNITVGQASTNFSIYKIGN